MITEIIDHKWLVARVKMHGTSMRRCRRRYPRPKVGGEAWQTWCAEFEDRYDDKWHEPFFTMRHRKMRKYHYEWLMKEYSLGRR